jgi:YidC/Oxa1 family membrane protein insertase
VPPLSSGRTRSFKIVYERLLMETKRLILFVVFSFSLLLLWDSWQQKQNQVSLDVENANLTNSQNSTFTSIEKEGLNFQLDKGKNIVVDTDLYQATISSVGADIRQLKLKNYQNDDKTGTYQLFDDANDGLLYVAQSGLVGDALPTHKDDFNIIAQNYNLSGDELIVPLVFENDKVKVTKTYRFVKGMYNIHLNIAIENKTTAPVAPQVYYQLIHDDQSNQGSSMMPSFTGVSYFNEDKKFNKIKFSDINNQKPFSLNTDNGWSGIIQRYFASAWIISGSSARQFYTKQISDHIYSAGVRAKIADIPSGATVNFDATLYAGPQIKNQLIKTARGLEYTVDYGWLTFIASPLFSLLKGIQSIVSNWGLSIILLTVLIKAFFYPLSASGYRSMAQLKELAPRLQSMKEKFGDDKVKMQQAMMELYKTEKINPLGGCLPILIQIPVFIALYWVLLGAVELRQAPFFGWITDLSVKDPLYVLPALMAASMFLQQKLNPKPADPMQARMMMIMPIVFSIFFFFFPAGLVLYWFVNNVLSMLQQWYVNKSIHAAALKKKGHG